MSSDVLKDSWAYILAHDYNFAPFDPGKYDFYNISDDLQWGVLADDKPGGGILIKFNSDGFLPG